MAKGTTAPKNDGEAQLARAVLDILAQEKWADITLASVARAAKLPLPDVLAIAPSKIALPGLILRYLAGETVRRHKAGPASGNPRERLFDVTMAWFDVQQSRALAL